MIIEFLIPTYNRKAELKSMLSSLIAQTDKEWIANVIIDSSEIMPAIDIVNSINDERIRITNMDSRYNDWGNTPIEYAKQKSNSDYVVMTGDDNYYVPVFVSEIKLAAKNNPGMIYYDMVHSHYEYHYFVCHPAHGHIDRGAFATRTDLAKQIPLSKNFASDGEFVNDFVKKFSDEEIVKIGKVLFVHN